MGQAAAPLQLPLTLCDLPIDLQELTAFVLSGTLNQALVNSATNTFFTSMPALSTVPTISPGGCTSIDGAESAKPTVRVRTKGGCWDVLPLEWRRYFDGVAIEQREAVLKILADGILRDGLPPSLSEYLSTCQRLTLPRACSTTPILSFPPRPTLPPPSPPLPAFSASSQAPLGSKHTGKKSNSSRAGQSPKKAHEVDRFGELVDEMLRQREREGHPVSHCIDVGSGRAHLSRALAAPPLSLHVLAVDWSASQTSGAEYLDGLKDRGPRSGGKVEEPTSLIDGRQGSLTHRTSALDAAGIADLMTSWPSPSDDGQDSQQEAAILVALHACGDLTIDAIKSFINDSVSSREHDLASRRTAILVGCCFNLQTPSLFPLSALAGSLSSPVPQPSSDPLASNRTVLTRQHLLLTAQSPSLWYSRVTPHSYPHPSTLPLGDALKKSLLKLAYRARLEAELSAAGHGSDGERRVGRVGECEGGWEEYRRRALARYGEEVEQLEMDGGERGWEEALWRMQVFWTVRSWLGPPMESLMVLDRWVYLVEGLHGAGEWERLGEGRRVELVNLFEQSTGSLRNLALVVR